MFWNHQQTLLLFAIYCSLIPKGFSIKCYSCISTQNPECEDPEYYDMERTSCDSGTLLDTKRFSDVLGERFSKLYDVQLLEAAIPLNCVKQVTRVRGQEVILRGCQLPKDYILDVCKKILSEPRNKDGIEVKHCSLCDIDGCNTSSFKILNPLAMIISILTTFLAKTI